MLTKVTIIIGHNGFQLEGVFQDGSHNNQTWEIAESPYSIRTGGQDWQELGIDSETQVALDKVVIATTKFSRQFTHNAYANTHHITVDVGPGWVDCLVAGNDDPGVILRYEWDDNGQMREVQVVSGDLDFLPQEFLNDFKEASFGRYGLLSRVMSRKLKVPEPMDDMGALRWA
ncbi:MAG: hypothetical protein JKY24_03880 [Pseudomonadales bacterium]|nr:hypothetical protein [Pseudomonadales bacterium]